MAQALGVKSVAEGIETEQQLRKLTDYGCDIAQGYYFFKPLSQEDFVEVLRKQAAGASHLTESGEENQSGTPVPLTLRYKSQNKV